MFTATGIRLSELAGIRYGPGDPARSDLDLHGREIRICGKGSKPRTVKIGHQAARSLDRYLRTAPGTPRRTGPSYGWEPATGGADRDRHLPDRRPPRPANAGVTAYPHRFRHHFSHIWLDRGGAERDLMELNGWTSPQMLTRYGASARGARARRSYDRIMYDT